MGEGENRRKKACLRLSKIGFFTLVIHTELPLERVCVKMHPSGRIYTIFLVEAETLGEGSLGTQSLW
ncbi:hypothetical protein B9Q03_11105 [Candidatus Marsarchaeota G2 archaeon OSP_D]|uniref:Uncharacterized protein n=1 Tax=Candidatus Marsarchaeota G2 archaeon OSP_D TaxID=1978157 RepID=A0A2R6AL67_9ARCH|nr:MAG: hypothetical protein B9Q03_11105 [Candidatus Marsarchaeota G2 archaeon OSP_D]